MHFLICSFYLFMHGHIAKIYKLPENNLLIYTSNTYFLIKLVQYKYPPYFLSTNDSIRGKILNKPGFAIFKEKLSLYHIISENNIYKLEKINKKQYKMTEITIDHNLYFYLNNIIPKNMELNNKIFNPTDKKYLSEYSMLKLDTKIFSLKEIIMFRSKRNNKIYRSIENKNIIFKILIVNSVERFRRLSKDTNKNAYNILSHIRYFLPINIQTIDIINFTEFINENDPDKILKVFYEKMNNFIIGNEINVNLSILLLEDEILKCNNIIQGTTYYNGACSINQGYSVLFINPNNSDEENGRVLAHEILHSLGAKHENIPGSIMNYLSDPDNNKITESTYNEIKATLGDKGCFKSI
ncbi:hypothetical protein SLOPH_547 [Spraguea lophii 42_110]|uniref:Peptidase M12B domain-containing protein n=1 Tax=Spraguea lophii (strain 42_110) TaxID=1358809 RepID=S7WA62_SPRLO|nr:hypothetical protein SLOPH_547 [Spraguea lophii 42_110]